MLQGYNAKGDLVTVTDPAKTLADLNLTVDPPPAPVITIEQLKTQKKAAVAKKRYEIETAGITVAGSRIKTDRESRATLTDTWVRVQQAPTVLIDWKGENGWVQLDKAAVESTCDAVGAHVQACFTAERAHHVAIDALAADPATTGADMDAYDINTGWPVL